MKRRTSKPDYHSRGNTKEEHLPQYAERDTPIGSPGNGRPAIDDPRRCQKNPGVRGPCFKWAVKGSRFCHRHGGRKYQTGVRRNTVAGLPVKYRKFLHPTLNEAVAQALETDPREQVSLFEELALMREHAGQVIKLWSAAHESGKTELIVATGTEMQVVLMEVAKLAGAAAAITNGGKDKYSVHDFNYVVTQLTQIMHKVCERHDRHDIADDFQAMVEDELILPTGRADGTDLTPDMLHTEIVSMDNSIPYVPEEVEEDESETDK